MHKRPKKSAFSVLPVDIQNRILEFTHKCSNCRLVSLYTLEIKSYLGVFSLCRACCTFRGTIENIEKINTKSFCDLYNIHIDKLEQKIEDRQYRRHFNIRGCNEDDIEEHLTSRTVDVLVVMAYIKQRGNLTDFHVCYTNNAWNNTFCISVSTYVNEFSTQQSN